MASYSYEFILFVNANFFRYLNSENEVQMKKKLWDLIHADYSRRGQKRKIKHQSRRKTATWSPTPSTKAESQAQSSTKNDVRNEYVAFVGKVGFFFF